MRLNGRPTIKQLHPLTTCPFPTPHCSIWARGAAVRWSSAPANRSDHDIAVLGGGITGLATAHYLAKEAPHARITVYEAGPRVGGWVQSRRVDLPGGGGSVVFEQGPRTLRPRGLEGNIMARLIGELELQERMVFTPDSAPAALNRYIYYPDHLVRMPFSGESWFRRLWNIFMEPVFEGVFEGLWKIVRAEHAEPNRRGDESVGDVVARLGHKGIADNLLSALVHGIYAGDVWQLSAKSIQPLLWHMDRQDENWRDLFLQGMQDPWQRLEDVRLRKELKARPGEGVEKKLLKQLKSTSVYSFQGGIEDLTTGLERVLKKKRNVTFNTGFRVNGLRLTPDRENVEILAKDQPHARANQVISTLFSRTTASLCKTPAGETLLPSLASSHAVTVMVVNLFYTNPDLLKIDGFGYLIPQSIPFEQNPERALGVIFDSCTTSAQDTATGTKLTVMLGGHWWDGWGPDGYPTDEEGITMARTVLARHLGIVDEPALTHVALQRDAIPQYTVGHTDRLMQAHRDLAENFKGRVKVAGASYHGVGLNDCVRGAMEIASAAVGNGWEGKTGLEGVKEHPEYVRKSEGSSGKKA